MKGTIRDREIASLMKVDKSNLKYEPRFYEGMFGEQWFEYIIELSIN